jgi:predicted dehydrogenase
MMAAGAKRSIRIGLAGLAALYWPVCIAEGVKPRRDAKLVSFATLGVSPQEIKDHLGMLPEEYASSYRLKGYDSVAGMIAAEGIDAVAICARHTEHARLVKEIAPHGRDIFIAKTFTTTMADARRICELERKHGIHVAVGPSARFLPWFAAAGKAVAEGRIGTPFSVRISHHHGTIDVFNKKDFYRDPAEGGPELSLGWYLVDLVLHLMKRPVRQVTALYGTYTTRDSPFMDCGKLTMRLDGGAMASCDMYFCNRFEFPGWEMELVGDKGAILVRQSRRDPAGTSVVLTTPRGRTSLPLPTGGVSWELFWIDDFRSGREPSLTAGYACDVTRICLAARDSARTGRTVRLA